MMQDHYRILGVSPTADSSAIQRAYYKQAAKCHPDRGGSHEQMVQLNESWQVLSNPSLRREYDAIRNQTATPEQHTSYTQRAETVRKQASTYQKDWSEFEAAIRRHLKNAGQYAEKAGHYAGKAVYTYAYCMAILGRICIVVFIIIGILIWIIDNW